MAPVLNQPDYATAVQNQKKQNDKEKEGDLLIEFGLDAIK